MGDRTTIEWTRGDDGKPGATWNPVIGCSRVSPGCDGCYAIGVVHRGMSPQHVGLTVKPDGGRVDWTGEVRPAPQSVLEKPLHWKRPRRIFVNSLSDLFHVDLPDEEIAKVFAVMALAPQHTFQCLTKRTKRMRDLLSSQDFRHLVAQARDRVLVDQDHARTPLAAAIVPGFPGYSATTDGEIRRDGKTLKAQQNPRTGRLTVSLWVGGVAKTMPVHRLVLLAFDPEGQFPGAEVCHRNGDKLDNRRANLRWGTRSENQNEKVAHGARGGPAKLTTDQVAQIRERRASGIIQQRVADEFEISRSLVSLIEHGHVWVEPDLAWPLPNVWLGVSIETDAYSFRANHLRDTPAAVRMISAEPLLGPLPSLDLTGIDWLIVGGESGPKARPMHPQWARDLRDRCVCTGASDCRAHRHTFGCYGNRSLDESSRPTAFLFKQHGEWAPITDDMDHRRPGAYVEPDGSWRPAHEALPSPDAVLVRRVGKKAAGRELDGRTWDEYPA